MIQKFLAFVLVLMCGSSVLAAYGEFTDESLIPPDSQIRSVEVRLFDYVKLGYGKECKDTQCYRVDVFLNGLHVAQWIASPGKPQADGGDYTFPYPNGISFSRTRIYGPGYKNRDDAPMPWAAFWNRNDGGWPVMATHCGRVDGKRRSHGCVRLRCYGKDPNGRPRNDAKRINQWVRAAYRNGGTATMYTRHTHP